MFHIYNLTALLNCINMRNYYVLTVPKLDGKLFFCGDVSTINMVTLSPLECTKISLLY